MKTTKLPPRFYQLKAVVKECGRVKDTAGWQYHAARANAYLFAFMPARQFAIILESRISRYENLI